VTIQGNHIGVDASGATGLGNGDDGILVSSTSPIIRGNVISNNAGNGIDVSGAGDGIDESAVLWLKGENDFTDAVGSNNGVSVGGVTFGVGVGGGQAFELDGSTQHIEIADDPSLTVTDAITVEAWINPDTLTGGSSTFHPIASKYNAQANAVSWLFTAKGDGGLYFSASSDGTAGLTTLRIVETSDPVLTTGQYQHVAVTFDTVTQDVQIYVDGVPVPTTVTRNATVSSIATTATPVRIGAFRNGPGTLIDDFDGRIDEPAVYDSVLPPSAIAAIHAMNGAGKQGAVIQGNIIGLNAGGDADLGNTNTGVTLDGSAGNVIGGNTPAERNVISGNNFVGIFGLGAATTNNTIQGNYIGTDINGLIDLGNSATGIVFAGDASANLIGGDRTAGEGNLVSGNNNSGIAIGFSGSKSTNNIIQGNIVGLDVTGLASLSNGDGITIAEGASSGNLVGGIGIGQGNIVSGNLGRGVVISATGSDNNLLQGNIIGLNLTGTAAIGNGGDGVVIEGGASDNVVGGSNASARNVISGNSGNGIYLDAAGPGNQIAGNYIGTNAAGDAAIANGSNAVNVFNGSDGTIIGTDGDGNDDATEGNVIGQRINIETSANTVIAGNLIGVTADGLSDLEAGTNGTGIYVVSNSGTRIGTDADGTSDNLERNVISGFADAIHTRGGSSNNTIAGNFIGSDITGNAPIPNRWGILLFTSSLNTIGGPDLVQRNVIVANTVAGIQGQFPATNTTIQGNYVGVGADGTTVMGNATGIQSASNWVIGTDGNGNDDAGEGNIISGNATGLIVGSGDRVAGNWIGLDATGAVAGNTTAGINITRHGAFIGTNGDGTSDSLEGNVISGNAIGITTSDTIETTDAGFIAGNFIGTSTDGLSVIGNTGAGLVLNGLADRTIGGNLPVERNVIAGNSVGISSTQNDVTHTLLDNYIGTDVNGVFLGSQTTGLDIVDGNLFVNGTVVAPEGVVVDAAGTLGGIGTIDGEVINNGIVAPGNSPGILNTGNFTFATGSTLLVELGGTSPGNTATDHDQLNVTGTVDLGSGATLSVLEFGGFTPSVGDSFVIINNDGVDPISGTFSGLANGATVSNGAFNYTITYVGGDGNDVVLTYAGATFVVDSTGDTIDGGDGVTTLREAITQANALAGADTITFNISSNEGAGPHTIAPLTALPVITETVAINGYSESGALVNSLSVGMNTVLQVVLSGINIPAEDGLNFDGIGASGSSVRGLAINQFSSGIRIFVADNVVVAGNFIGTDVTGVLDLGNTDRGIEAIVAQGTRIGGSSLADRNLISGNDVSAVYVQSTSGPTDAQRTRIQGNYIGTDVSGTLPIGNANVVPGANGAINLSLLSDVIIGTDGDGVDDANEGNLISGNTAAGIRTGGSSRVVIAGNLIGTDATGQAPLGNSNGIVLLSSDLNRIGTNSDGVSDELERNVISGNVSSGIMFVASGGSTIGNAVVAGNFIGTNLDGTAAVGNGGNGILLSVTDGVVRDVVIGGTKPTDRNVIAGHNAPAAAGIRISGGIENTIIGNYIGINASGDAPLANTYGIRLMDGAANNTIGGASPGQRNVISGNSSDGVLIESDNNTVVGNFIGTDALGTSALGNQGNGVLVLDASGVVVGTDSDGNNDFAEGNVISGNTLDGVLIAGAGSAGTIVAGNHVGVDVTGSTALVNQQFGVSVAADNVMVGGSSTAARNVIIGSGILVNGNPTNTRIQGNYIGLDASGLNDIGPVGAVGISVNSGTQTIIGVDGDGIGDAGEGNVISGNFNNISMGPAAEATIIAGNIIGLDKNGDVGFVSGNTGIRIGGDNHRIGTDGDGVSDILERN
ncbi:MAG: LamG-like jellyroll fold domain-containing protein, partial [Pirellulaceae bacterium]